MKNGKEQLMITSVKSNINEHYLKKLVSFIISKCHNLNMVICLLTKYRKKITELVILLNQ